MLVTQQITFHLESEKDLPAITIQKCHSLDHVHTWVEASVIHWRDDATFTRAEMTFHGTNEQCDQILDLFANAAPFR